MMKQKQSGFTVIELMVVCAIMATIATLFVLNFNKQQKTRSVVLAQNETVTNLRKIQSYLLSSRNLPNNQPVKFYIVKFARGSNKIQVQAVDSTYTFYSEVESIKLPGGVIVSSIDDAVSNVAFAGGKTQAGGDQAAYGGDEETVDIAQQTANGYDCAQVAFAAPTGKMFTYLPSKADFCGQDSDIVAKLQNPPDLFKLANKGITVTLTNSDATLSKTITLNGLSGNITTE
jgi:prepilin-type N-terminal cleavage/methylation domain-containing protein